MADKVRHGTCDVCGKPYKTPYPSKKYCSIRCNEAAQKRKARERKRANKEVQHGKKEAEPVHSTVDDVVQ